MIVKLFQFSKECVFIIDLDMSVIHPPPLGPRGVDLESVANPTGEKSGKEQMTNQDGML